MSILEALRVQKMNQRSVADLAALPQNEIVRLAQMGHIPADVVPVVISEKARIAKEMANLQAAKQMQGGNPTVIEQAMMANADQESNAQMPQSAAPDSGLAGLPTGQMFDEQRFSSGGIAAFSGDGPSWVQEPGGLNVLASESAVQPNSFEDYIQRMRSATAAARKLTPEEMEYAKAIKGSQLSPEDAKQQKWMRLLQAGLGIMGGSSPFASTNIGAGAKDALEGYASDIKSQRDLKLAGLKSAADLARTTRQEELQDIASAAKLYEGEQNRLDRAERAENSQLGAKYASNYLQKRRALGDNRPEAVILDEGYNNFFQNYNFASGRAATQAGIAAGSQAVTTQGQTQTARSTAVKEFNDLKLSDPVKREYNRLASQDKKNKEAGNPTNLAETFKAQQIDSAERRILGGAPAPSAAPAPAPAPAAATRPAAARTPVALPKTEAELRDGAVYQTARGPAIWNAAKKQFIPVGR